eukprot:m.258837 g.258837  ORF g.258837 m.258837 type:complete len:308 (-) comp37167_c0_seq1:971-1894(-)
MLHPGYRQHDNKQHMERKTMLCILFLLFLMVHVRMKCMCMCACVSDLHRSEFSLQLFDLGFNFLLGRFGFGNVRWQQHCLCSFSILFLSPTTKGNEFFPDCWMNGNRGLEIGAGGAHTHSNSKTLHHLVGEWANAVQSNHEFCRAGKNHFQARLHFALGFTEREDHRFELGFLDLHVVSSELLDCLRLGQSDHADGWVAENDGGDGRVVDACSLFALEHTVTKTSTSSNSHRRELVTAGGGITDGEHIFDVCVFVSVDRDVTSSIRLHTSIAQVEHVCHGCTSSSNQDAVEPSIVTRICAQCHCSIG